MKTYELKYMLLLLLTVYSNIQFAQETIGFKGHTKKINNIAFSPDGELLATASDDKTIRIWSLASGKRVATLRGHEEAVLCVEFSQNGQELLSGSKDTQIKLWNIAEEKEIRTYKSHKNQVNTIKFSPLNDYFISGDSKGEIHVWKIGKSKSIKVLSNHTNAINALIFSPDGKYFASASDDNSVKLWSAASQKVSKTYLAHTQGINSICFSSDSKLLYSASSDKTIKTWKISSAKPINSIDAHEYAINSLQISNDGNFLFSTSDDGSLKTWNLATFENVFTYKCPDFNELKALKLSPNEKKLAFSNTTTIPQLINTQTFEKEIDRTKSTIWAVIVGISEYQFRDKSEYSVNDALRTYGFYKSPEGGALKDEQIKVLTNHQATDKFILNAVNETFKQANDSDIVIFYFSGHGESDGLVPYNANDDSPNLNYELLIRAIEKSKAMHKICIIDACYSGNLANIITSTERNITSCNAQKNMVFLLSSKEKEQALGYRNLNQGIFSYFLLNGLNGNANQNDDNIISITELFDYVNYNVKNYTNSKQNPILIGNFDENLKIGLLF